MEGAPLAPDYVLWTDGLGNQHRVSEEVRAKLVSEWRGQKFEPFANQVMSNFTKEPYLVNSEQASMDTEFVYRDVKLSVKTKIRSLYDD